MKHDGGPLDPAPGQIPTDDKGRRLESWKEIADYFHRGVTTVQRWEHEEGLPVRRHDHTTKGSVYAYASELDEWRARRDRPARAIPEPPALNDSGVTSRGDQRRTLSSLWTVVGVLAVMATLAISARVWSRYTKADPQRSVQRPLANEPEIERNPSLSPDGRFVVYHWWRKHGGRGLFIKDIDSGQVRRMTGDDGRQVLHIDDYPAWSPKGDLIAFLRGRHQQRRDLMIASAFRGQPERKVTDADGISLSWLPDGKRLAMVDRRSAGDPFAVFLVSVETGERTRLTTPPIGLWGDIYSAVSPDGRTLAFVRFLVPAAGDLYVMPLTGGEPRRLTTDAISIERLSWTPDGAGIVFASYRGGSLRLWHINATSPEGAEPTLVVGAQGGSTSPTFSRAETGSLPRLVYQHEYKDVNVWRGTLDPHWQATAVGNSTAYDDQPAISPDSARIAFVSNRTGPSEIWLANVDGSNARQLTSIGALSGGPRWSPDGRRLVFSSQNVSGGDIYAIEADGTSVRRLTAEPSNETRPSWSNDGRWVYFTSNRSGVDHIWKTPANGSGPASDVTQSAAIEGYESPDGRLLYFVRGYDLGGIMSVPVDGGRHELVLPGVRSGFWESTRAGIVYLSVHETQPAEKPMIKLFDPMSKAFRDLGMLPSATGNLESGFAASPDARTILWSQFAAELSDLVLVEPWMPVEAPRSR